jgi:transmembrane sensor
MEDDPFAKEAAQWLVRLSACANEASAAALRADFAAWKQRDPRHAAAAARLERLIGQLSAVRDAGPSTAPAHAALEAALDSAHRARPSRLGHLGKALAFACLLALPVWLALRVVPPSYLLADLRTGTGEQTTHVLPDGSRVTLDTASAINLQFNESGRTVELVRGDILVDVAHDRARPFVVTTPHGSIRALGTRFVVSEDGRGTDLSMLESRVAVHPAAAPPDGGDTVVQAGERVRVTRTSVGPAQAIDVRSIDDAWRLHQIVVRDMPLPDVLDRLERHRFGHIVYDRAQLARYRVSAVLPQDDTGRALQLLVDSFPIRVRMLTPWLVMVDQAPSP